MKLNSKIIKALFESKVSNSYNGVAYHGTNSNFDKFTYVDRGRNTSKVREVYGPGFYFTSNPDYAKNYGKNIIKANISIKKPLVCKGLNLPQLSKEQIKQLVIAWYDFANDENKLNLFKDSFFAKFSKGFWKGNGTEEDLNKIANECNSFSFVYDTLFKEHFKKYFISDLNYLFGYDGVICELDKETTIYVVWFEEQIEKL